MSPKPSPIPVSNRAMAVFEGSVGFSLKELARLEEERVRELREAEARSREAEETARAQAEAVRLAHEREEALRADAERRAAERRAREEEESAEAARLATMEAARREVDVRATQAEHDRRRRHELEIARAGGLDARRRLVRTLWAEALVSLAVLSACVAVYYGKLAPAAQARIARLSSDLAAREGSLEELRARARGKDEALASLRADLVRAQARIDELTIRLAQPTRGPGSTPHSAGPNHPTSTPLPGLLVHCDPGSHDPLCGNLGR